MAATPEVLIDATSVGSPVVLDKAWRVGITSSPNAANPDFDDSTWVVRDAKDAIADVPDEDRPPIPPPPPPGSTKTEESKPGDGRPGDGKPRDDTADPDFNQKGRGPDHQRPWVWFRIHIKLQPNHGPLALLVELPVSHTTNVSIGAESLTPDIYANGKLIKPDGPHNDHPERYQSISRVYNLDVPPSQTSLVLVVRTLYVPVGYGTYTAFFANRTFHLGAPNDLTEQLELWTNHSLFERLPRLVTSILLVVLGLFLLALYFTQKGHTEYLWLGMHELTQAPIAFFELGGSSAHIDLIRYGAITLQAVLLSAYLYFEFLISFLDLKHRWENKRKRWIIRLMRYTAPILVVVGPSLLLVERSTAFVVIFIASGIGSVFWIGAWLLFSVITLIAATARRNFEAGLLLFPLVLEFVGILEPVFSTSMADWTGHSYQSPLTMQLGPVPIHFATVADFIGLLAIVVIIFFRFLRIQRDRERASSELAAARSVQELLIPQMLKTPGFQVDSIYNPAAEVGGDFYHVEPTMDGGLVVVIGDVAGKGLRAAMNVSMVMGALRRSQERSPARILDSLNRVLVGSDGITTCQAIWFAPNGEVVIANAGHLPPYLNTQEVNLPGGLPLGVLETVNYDEVRLYLHPGDRLLLMSDGVVEARRSGGELFGFDRVHNLSNQSAFYIADAAKAFGQEDDITVLTVRRLAAAVAA
ncbi:MAG TPA: SpoIIE family protein phosphatase [Terracidiphilus sp.]